MRRSIVLAAVGVLAAGIGGGVAYAATSGKTDPAAEREAEARYTEAHRAEAAVSQADAEKAAVALHPGTIIDTHLEKEGHGLRWEVKPDDGTQVWEVQVDAATGAVVSDQLDD